MVTMDYGMSIFIIKYRAMSISCSIAVLWYIWTM